MKKAVAIIAALAAGVWALTACADTWTDPATGITWTYTVSGGQASVGDGSSDSPAVPKTTSGTLAIPSTINGYSVTSIGYEAFSRCSGLTSVTIPDSVTSIGYAAFYGCSGLTSVTIPDSVTSIEYAFGCCSGLTSFIVGDGNANYKSVNGLLLSKDGKALLAGVNGDVTIPHSVTSIGEGVFYCCSGLTSVTIPNSVTSIGDEAFRGCSGLTSVTIPDSVTSIGDWVFSNCSRLTSVTIPNSVTSIGDYAFYDCSGLTSVTIPDSVTSIGYEAFYGCSGLTSVTIPDSVTSIGRCAFYGCGGIIAVRCRVLNIENAFYDFSGALLLARDVAKDYIRALGVSRFGGYIGESNSPRVEIISSAIRENDPTVMDVVYKVTINKPTVKIRALAFEDGERSFAKVVRPETFVDGTAPANWDAVEANVEHTLSWKVSSDWATRLAKVKFEILASDDDLLPLELRTIPASDQYGKMKISWNAITERQVFDALLWQYADKDPGLTLAGGVLRNGGVTLASGAQLSGSNTSYDENGKYVGSHWLPNSASPAYLLGKMGYQLLTGAPLSYANSETRLNLRPYGVRQYAYKIVEE